jgi:hypothetical protein
MSGVRRARCALFLAPLCASCREAPLTCPTSLAPSLAVTIRDSATGAFIASGATVIAFSTLYSDTVFVPAKRPDLDSQPVELSYGRTGPFLVTVDEMGYSEWMATDVIVRAAVCGLETTALTARLQRTP